MNQMYGFEGEVKAKYTAQMFQLFSEVFQWLPLAQCINNKVLVSTEPIFTSPSSFLTCFFVVVATLQEAVASCVVVLLLSMPGYAWWTVQ